MNVCCVYSASFETGCDFLVNFPFLSTMIPRYVYVLFICHETVGMNQPPFYYSYQAVHL